MQYRQVGKNGLVSEGIKGNTSIILLARATNKGFDIVKL
jgi:hypothetical protein